MRIPLAAWLLALGCTPLLAQVASPVAGGSPGTPQANSAPAATGSQLAATPQVQDSELGFSYRLPSDWQFVALPSTANVLVPYPSAVGPKKGDACTEVDMTGRHGTSGSVVVVLKLSFECFGQSMSQGDLADFGLGATAGLKASFEIVSEAEGTYSLGDHTIWIERGNGTPKGHPENPYTFEIACTLLGKGAVCWLIMAGDAASLHDFEQEAVTLEGEKFEALVPPGAAPAVPATIPKKPS